MNAEVAIIGAGLGGLSVALSLAASRKSVLICKGGLPDGASDWGQGSIAAVLDSPGSTSSHSTFGAAN